MSKRFKDADAFSPLSNVRYKEQQKMENSGVAPNEPVCAKCGDSYGAPSHNFCNWMWHQFKEK